MRCYWRRGEKCYVTIGRQRIAGLVLDAPPDGNATVKIAMRGLDDRWIVQKYDKSVPFTKLLERDSKIDGLDFE